MVVPSSASSTMTSSTSLIISGSRAEVGSSKSMSLGSMAKARAMAARCCWPPDSSAGTRSALSAMPTRSSSFMAWSRASALDTLRTFIGPMVTFWRTVLWAKRLNDWNTMPTSARSRASALPSSGRATPSIEILPDVTGSRRLMHRIRVDLPEPDGPTTISTSPRPTSRSMSWSTCRSPKNLLTFSTTTRGVVGPAGPAGAGAGAAMSVMRRPACGTGGWTRPPWPAVRRWQPPTRPRRR